MSPEGPESAVRRNLLGNRYSLGEVSHSFDLTKQIGPLDELMRGEILVPQDSFTLRGTVFRGKVQRWVAIDQDGAEIESILYREPSESGTKCWLYVGIEHGPAYGTRFVRYQVPC